VLNTAHRPFRTLAEIRRANAATGQSWFSPSTMRWFSSRVEAGPYLGRYFITSEAPPGREEDRRFTLRCADDDGTISTLGAFMAHATKQAAREALRACLNPRAGVTYDCAECGNGGADRAIMDGEEIVAWACADCDDALS
jgi:hypothetical protein